MTAERHRPTLQVAEPSPRWGWRPPLVVDCSAVAGVVFGEAWSEEALTQMTGRSLHAPHLLACELANVALKKHRRGETHALLALADADALAIELHPVDPAAVAVLAQRWQLTAYDAAYLWLASTLYCPLVTFDERLADAARAYLGSAGQARGPGAQPPAPPGGPKPSPRA